MIPYRVGCTDCGTPQTGRKRALDTAVVPYQDTFTECGARILMLERRLEMSRQAATSRDDFQTALREQQQQVVTAVAAEETIDATPILQDDESLSCEEYITLVYELHKAHLPELQAAGVIEFDRRNETVKRGPRFDEARSLLKHGIDR